MLRVRRLTARPLRRPQDGVVLGADTRATNDTVVADKNCEKIHYIAENIYCCGAGTAADTENTTGARPPLASLVEPPAAAPAPPATPAAPPPPPIPAHARPAVVVVRTAS